MKSKILTFFTLCMLTLMFASCGKKEKKENVQYVKTFVATGTPESSEMNYPGRTKASEEVNLAFRVSGTIERMLVNDGDYVRKGQVVAMLDARDYKVQLEATQAEYEQVKASAERVIAMYNDSSTTAANYDKARYGLQQITQKLQNHRNQLADTRLVAPISGYISTRLHESGETVAAGMPVVRIMNGDNIEVEINVPASDYARREQFSDATCSFDLFPGEVFPLSLISFSKSANASQLYSVRLRINGNYDRNKITPGMLTMVHATFHEEGERNFVEVPSTALLHTDDVTYVFVVNKQEGTVSRRAVEVNFLGRDGRAQIRSGLKSGETVVTAGVRYLTDGQKVKEIKANSKANVGGLL